MARLFPLSRNKFTPCGEVVVGTCEYSKATEEGYRKKLTKLNDNACELLEYLEKTKNFNFTWYPRFVVVEAKISINRKKYLEWLDKGDEVDFEYPKKKFNKVRTIEKLGGFTLLWEEHSVKISRTITITKQNYELWLRKKVE